MVIGLGLVITVPALANRLPCSNCASESTSPPLPSSSLPYPPPRHETAPLKPARGSGVRCKLPQRGLSEAPAAVAFCCIVCSQKHLVAAFLVVWSALQ